MDKNIIKQHLTERFINEAKGDSATPGISVTNAANKKSGAINKAGVKAIEKDVTAYDKDLKKNKSEVKDNKFNYNDSEEKEYHNDMEIMNGQEMIRYDRDPNKLFKDKAKEAIVGSTRMGNKGGKDVGNAEETWGASSDEFGEDFIKRVKATTKKRAEAEDKFTGLGDDVLIDPSKPKTKTHKPRVANSALAEGITEASKLGNGYTHFALLNGKIADGWDYKGQDNDSIKYYTKEDLRNNFPDNKLKEFTVVTKANLLKKGIDPSDTNNWYKPTQMEGDEQESKKVDAGYGSEDEHDFYNKEKTSNPQIKNNNNPQIKESMKRLKFKKDFNGVGNALKMIPESYREDNKEFEMTDGNESYRIRWEGTLTEGRAVVLRAANKTMINEDMQHMKHLMGYKSQDTLGAVKGNARLNENAVFGDIWNKSKALLEGEDIEDADAKEGDLDDAVKSAPEAKKDIEGSVSTDKGTQAPAPKTGSMESFDKVKKQAPEAKEDIEGSVSTDKGTQAPKPKVGHWEDINVPQAAEAKKHVTMNENEEEEIPENPEDYKEQPGYVHETEEEDDEEDIEEIVDESIQLMVSESTGKLYIVSATAKPFAVPAKDNAKALKNPKKYISEVFKK